MDARCGQWRDDYGLHGDGSRGWDVFHVRYVVHGDGSDERNDLLVHGDRDECCGDEFPVDRS